MKAKTIEERAAVAAHGLIADLWHELPGSMIDRPDDLGDLKQGLVHWIKNCCAYLADRKDPNQYHMVSEANYLASDYYICVFQQTHHTYAEYVYFCRHLSRALLRANNWQPGHIQAHMGHYRTLSSAVDNMLVCDRHAGKEERAPFVSWYTGVMIYKNFSTPN